MLEKIKETANYLKKQTSFEPEVGIILGTGLGNLGNEIIAEHTISYKEIPNFPVSTVEGHSGQLIFGELGGKKVVAMQGRFHFYEGYDMNECVFPVRVMKFLGIDAEIVGNNETIYYILTHLTKLQHKLNIYLPPKYKEKFYFIIGLTHQCINIKYENVVPLSKNKFTNLNLNITSLEELPDEYIYTIFNNSYQEIFTNNDSIESIKND